MKLIINPAWAELLKQAGLDTAEALLTFENEHCLSRHSRAAIWKTQLPDGQTVFLKRDFHTSPAPILRRLLRLHLPETNTERETRLLENARKLGFRVPEIIAHTQHSRWWIPSTGAMLELAVKGRPIDGIVQDKSVSDDEKRAAIRKAHDTLDRIQDAKLDWRKDCKPEHFFLCDDGEIALIDGERLYPSRKKLAKEYRDWQHQRFDSFLPEEWRNVR